MRRLAIGLAVVVVLVGAVSAEGKIIHKVFITSGNSRIDESEQYPPITPNFGGLHAADYVVTEEGWYGGLIGPNDWDFYTAVFRAILSIEGTDARDRLPISGPIYNMQGELIAISSDDLWDGTLEHGVKYNAWGQLVPEGTNIWTGTEYDGTHSGASCGAWNQTFGSGNTSDSPSGTNSAWILSYTLSGDDNARLYGLTAPYNTVTGEYLAWGTVPEPSALILLTTGALGLLAYGWRKRRS